MKYEKVILVTGGCGFIGSNLLKYMVNKYPEDMIVNLDLLTYAARQVMQEEDGDTILALMPDGRCPMWRDDGLCRILADDAQMVLIHDHPLMIHTRAHQEGSTVRRSGVNGRLNGGKIPGAVFGDDDHEASLLQMSPL